MDIISFIVDELVFFLTEKGIKRIKNEKAQIIVTAILSAVMCVLVTGFAGWQAVQSYQKGNLLAAIFFAVLGVLPLLLIGFIMLRRVIRKRKRDH